MSLPRFLRRIVRTGLVSFWRGGVVSVASLLIMSVTLLIVASLIFLNVLLDFTLAEIKDKVDVNIYFAPTAVEGDILELQQTVQALPEVARVEYITREQAIEQFRDRHADNYSALQALDVLEENPLGASLNIKAVDPSQYSNIADFLQNDEAFLDASQGLIDDVNFHNNEAIITRLNDVTNTVQRLGLVVTVFFIVVSVLITFNTIRLAIYAYREEVTVMRLVGAENTYIRGPFIISGMIYGTVSAIIAMLILLGFTIWTSEKTAEFFGQFDIYQYYMTNFWQILVILVVSGILLGVISSAFAIRKYLRK